MLRILLRPTRRDDARQLTHPNHPVIAAKSFSRCGIGFRRSLRCAFLASMPELDRR
jgi:hypothetical protein